MSTPPSKLIFTLNTVLCLAALSIGSISATAEGSKNLVQTSDYRPFLEYSTQSSTANIPRRSSVFAFVKSGEKIALGSSANGVGEDGSIE
jgi:hypothetical protein